MTSSKVNIELNHMLHAIIGAVAAPVAVVHTDHDGGRSAVAINPALARLLERTGGQPLYRLLHAANGAPITLGGESFRCQIEPLPALLGQGLSIVTLVAPFAGDLAGTLDLQIEMISRWRPDGAIEYCNEAFARQCGRPRQEVIGANLASLTPPAEMRQILDNLARLSPEAPSAGYDHSLIGPDGEERWQEWIDRGCFDSEGRLVDVLSVGRDITARKLAERRLAESEQRLKLALEAGHQRMWEAELHLTADGVELVTDDSQRDLTTILRDYHPHDRPGLAAAVEALVHGKASTLTLEVRRRAPDGGWAWRQYAARLADRDPSGSPLRLVGTTLDIHPRKEAEAHLRESEQRLRLALEAGSFGVWESDVVSGRIRFDASLLARHGWPTERCEFTLAEVRAMIHPRDRGKVRAAYGAARLGVQAQTQLEYRVRRGDGGFAWIEEHAVVAERDLTGRPIRLVGVSTDISARKASELRLAHLALHDPLTGLANRRAMAEALERALARAQRSGLALAVLALDLDGFKAINDRYGHPMGDAALVEVASRLRRTVRRSDLVARHGGDEFAVIAGDLKGPTPVVRLARRIRAALAEPLVLPCGKARIGVSIGVAFYPGDGETPELLLSHADRALYVAKREGVGCRLSGDLVAPTA